jgi:prepilin-type N-terminal cleavage/methylation domain-containing protein
MRIQRRQQRGFNLIELMVAMLLAGLILAATSGVIQQATGTDAAVGDRNELLRDARFAMDRMVTMTGGSRRLLLPLADNGATDWPENIREQTIPASPPVGSSSFATAVLAVTLPANIDLDSDGFPDADNDRDGRIDEDFPADIQFDYGDGIYLVDDNGNGLVDESFVDSDDDEGFFGADEDPVNGLDDDGDGAIDEDPGSDANGDGAPGIAGVDDDSDGQVDEGNAADDDEDGAIDEDWLDAVVFYLQGTSLIERHPVPWDETANGFISGRDFIASVIAENVTRFRVERMAGASGAAQLVSLELELTGSSGAVVNLETRVRIGGAL